MLPDTPSPVLFAGHSKATYYGAHSGYDLLPTFVGQLWTYTEARPYKAFISATNSLKRIPYVHKYQLPIARGLYRRGVSRLARITQTPLIHGLWGDFDPFTLSQRASRSVPVISTLHRPRSEWKPIEGRPLSSLSAAIVLYRAGVQEFKDLIGDVPIFFTRYGVDTDFFSPVAKPRERRRLLCVGRYLRDLIMIREVVTYLLSHSDDICFDLVLSPAVLKDSNFTDLTTHPRISWHFQINDEQLRELYQTSSLMFHPLVDGGANNALVEALACGCPVVSTAYNGVFDYGSPECVEIVPLRDIKAMILAIDDLLKAPERLRLMSEASRLFALQTLSWRICAANHVAIYEEVLKQLQAQE